MPFVNGIKAAREQIVARTDEERTRFLRKRGFSKSETGKIIETVLAEEGRKPESIFDFVQGITAVARDKPHQDARLDLEAQGEEAARPRRLISAKPEMRISASPVLRFRALPFSRFRAPPFQRKRAALRFVTGLRSRERLSAPVAE